MAKPKKVKMSKKTVRQFEVLGGTATFISAALVISLFLASSLDVVLIRSQQFASVVSATLVDLANKDRVENRLDGLTISPVLTRAAQMKADDMANKGYFAHTSPEGIDPWHWFEEAEYHYAYAGENLAVDFSDSSAVNAAWMNSPTHRANILDQNYTEIGIATAEGFYQGRPTTFVVQEFGKPLEDAQEKPPRVVQNIPREATETATASQVLGESTPKNETLNPDAVSGPIISVSYASPVEHAVASPSHTLKYIYYGFAAVILVLLAFATGFELHIRHLKSAAAAGGILAFMLLLFVAGNSFIFTPPQVPDAGMAAAATVFQH